MSIDRHAQTTVTRGKIGKSLEGSAWRRSAKDKSKSDMQSTAGAWEEDFSTPSRSRAGRRLLVEEYNHRMDYD